MNTLDQNAAAAELIDSDMRHGKETLLFLCSMSLRQNILLASQLRSDYQKIRLFGTAKRMFCTRSGQLIIKWVKKREDRLLDLIEACRKKFGTLPSQTA